MWSTGKSVGQAGRDLDLMEIAASRRIAPSDKMLSGRGVVRVYRV